MKVIHILRKPLSEGTVASNTLKHGTGGINIDASRISSDGSHFRRANPKRKQHDLSGGDRDSAGAGMFAAGSTFTPTNHPGGRWPANVILQHLDGCRCAGIKRVGGTGTAYEPAPKAREHMIYGDGRTLGRTVGYADEDGKETVANWICEPGCPVARLDEKSGVSTSTGGGMKRSGTGNLVYSKHSGHPKVVNVGHGDTGGASRFYKQVGGKFDG